MKDVLITGETVSLAFKLVRDLIVFTDFRLILVDKQGMTGKKVEYKSIPYRSISRFSVETSGHFDLDAELKFGSLARNFPRRRFNFVRIKILLRFKSIGFGVVKIKQDKI